MPKTRLALSRRHRRRSKRSMITRKIWNERKLKAYSTPPIDGKSYPVLEEEIELIADDVHSAQQNIDEPLMDLEIAWELKEEKEKPSQHQVAEGTSHLEEAWGTQADMEEVMAHEMTIEKVKEDNILSGYRVVEISYFTNSIIKITQAHASVCTAAVPKIVNERRHGFVSTLTMECSMCYRTYTLSTEDPSSENVINRSVAWGTLATGSTYEHMLERFSVMDVPCMSKKMFYETEEQLSHIWMASSVTEMENAAADERTLAIENNDVDYDGMPWITVYLDGGWSKRSYGHNYNAASGVGVIIGKRTGKILYMGVRNKFCVICTKSANANVKVPTHTCFRNWTGSSAAMESDIIVEGFMQSEKVHGLRYKKIIADGDSSVYSKIIEKVSYGRQVLKLECKNHVIKNYGKRLYTLKNDTRSVSLAARKLLSADIIKQLQKCAEKAVYDNAHGDIGSLINDLNNGPAHVFMDHAMCKDYNCTNVGDDSKSRLPDVKSSGLYRHIHGALNLVVRKASSLIDNETNNRAELFMSILARFNMGKRLNLIQRGSFQNRANLTTLRYNKGFEWHYSSWKTATKRSPGKYFKLYMTRKLQSATLKTGAYTRQRKTQPKARVCLDYGPAAQQPPLDEDQVAEECERTLRQLEITLEERNRIAEETIGQFDNPLYISFRSDRLTASNFGAVIRRQAHTSCHSLVKCILQRTSFSTPATEYGKMKEAVAISLLEEKLKMKVNPSGLYIDTLHPFLAASPDGLVGSTHLVEVKCLFKLAQQDLTLDEGIKKFYTCLEKKNGKIQLKRNHNYYYQVQGQLHITGREACYFVVYINDKQELFVEEILRDDDLWNDVMVEKLVNFYTYCILPEIVRGNLKRGEKCLDPDYIIQAKAEYDKRKLNKKPNPK